MDLSRPRSMAKKCKIDLSFIYHHNITKKIICNDKAWGLKHTQYILGLYTYAYTLIVENYHQKPFFVDRSYSQNSIKRSF